MNVIKNVQRQMKGTDNCRILQRYSLKRITFMLIGIVLIGMCVAAYRMSGFGVDPFTCMNLGISGFNRMLFGTWQLIVNVILLVVVFFTVRHCIGIGTIINMICVGYIADFLCWIMQDKISFVITLPTQIGFLVIGTLFASVGCAMYMAAELGIAPYDSVAFIITKAAKDKVSFRMARIASDITCVCIGVIFCMLSHGKLSTIIGIGTLVNAFCNGPLIQFFRKLFQKNF